MNKLIKLGLVLTVAVSLASCNIDFNGIGKDDDGNDITVLLLDIPECDVTYTFTAVDAVTGTPLTSQFTARIIPDTTAAGGLANPDQILVTDAMKVSLQHQFTGSLELLLNPNIAISDNNPVGFTVVVESSDPNYIGIPAYVRSTEKGKREINLEVINLNSPVAGDFRAGLSKSIKPKYANFVTTSGVSVTTVMLLNRDIGNGLTLQGLYEANESGMLSVNCSDPAFEDYGFFPVGYAVDYLMRKQMNIVSGQLFYIIRKPANLVSGKIFLDVNSSLSASTSFNYSVETSAGTYSGTFRNTVPFKKQCIEQIFANSSSKSAVITLTPSSSFNLVGESARTVADITVSGGAVAAPAFEVSKPANLTLFNIKLTGTCAKDRTVSIAPSKSFVYRKTGTTEWMKAEMIGGSVSLLLESGADYDFGVSFDGKFYEYMFTTSQENIHNVLSNQYVEKYVLIRYTDGTYNIRATVVAPEICEITGNN